MSLRGAFFSDEAISCQESADKLHENTRLLRRKPPRNDMDVGTFIIQKSVDLNKELKSVNSVFFRVQKLFLLLSIIHYPLFMLCCKDVIASRRS